MDDERQKEIDAELNRLRQRYDPTMGRSRPEEIAQDFDHTASEMIGTTRDNVREARATYLETLKQSDLDCEAEALKQRTPDQLKWGLRDDLIREWERREKEVSSDPQWQRIRKATEERHARDYETISERFGQVRDETLKENGHDPDPATWEINQKRDVLESEGRPPQELPLWEAAERREATFDQAPPERSMPERDLSCNRSSRHDFDR